MRSRDLALRDQADDILRYVRSLSCATADARVQMLTGEDVATLLEPVENRLQALCQSLNSAPLDTTTPPGVV